MATKYVYADNTAWVATGVIGPQTIEAQGPEVLVHFGTLPGTYAEGMHHHLNEDDVPFYYAGDEESFIRSANNNVLGITQKCKAVITDG